MTSPWRWLAFARRRDWFSNWRIRDIATRALHVSLNSIIDLDPESTLAVFGGSEANLRLGLETLLGVLNTSSRQGLNAELTRYT
ncbi:putative lysogenization regulator [Klebsiella pneumoniae]|nr:putative lysogenization regulator [Klebsiella pneumoniae]